ncbi:MAG: hypothetical protein ACRC6I_22155 [Paracoccaceae bacterium]
MLGIIAHSLLVATRLEPRSRPNYQGSHEMRQDMLLEERRLREARLRAMRWG